MGTTWILDTPELEDAFRTDWTVHEIPLKEMAAMYGFRNINSVSRAARRLGLPKRPGGPSPDATYDNSPRQLTNGSWVRVGHRLVWMENA